MRKLRNPFLEIENYQCFGCAPGNDHGLQMEFYEDGDDIVSFWDPQEYFQGYNSILHGGIRSTLIDEIASWVVFVKLKTSGYTKSLAVDFIKPVYTNQGRLELRARLKAEPVRNLVPIEVELKDHKGEVATTGLAEYFVVPEKIARRRMFWPGIEAFYPDPGDNI